MAETYPESDDGKVVQGPRNPEAAQRRWLKEIEKAQRYFRTWERNGETIIKLYRKQASESAQTPTKRKFAMLWANTEILKPTLYARVPEPVIGRRFKDKDVPGRLASDMLERAASYIFDTTDFDATMKGARDDCLLPGRGTAWIRFIEDGVIAIDYSHWRDFLHEPARRWEEVTWVAHRSYMTRDEMGERFKSFPADKLKSMEPDNLPRSGISEQERKTMEGKFSVWEIWDKRRRRVCFITPTATIPLEESDPFLDLDGFWPTPRPIYSTMTTDSLIPVPDYKYYQDQAEEIDDLTRRIAALTDGLKLVGFYPKGSEAATEIENALLPTTENKMIGVEAWAAFSEKGGIKSIVFLPIQEVVETIKACVELRTQLIQDVYQITGISDIMRGSTDPNETLGAQELKAQTGNVRIRDRQADIQRFARDMLRIVCEIIAEKFSPGVLMQMTNMQQVAMEMAQSPDQQAQPQPGIPPGMPPQGGMPQPMGMGMAPPGIPPQAPPGPPPEVLQNLMQAFQLLKDDRLRGFRIDIETDSTVQPDENAEKQRRIEFATAMGSLFKEAVPLVQTAPATLPLVGETMRFVTRGFRAGKQLEDVLDKTLKALEAQAQAAASAPPKPTPEEIDQERLRTVDKPKGDAEAALKNAQAQQIGMQTQLAPHELALKQDQMILGDAQKSEALQQSAQEGEAERGMQAQQFDAQQEGEAQDRNLQAEQFDKTQGQEADQFAATQAAEQQQASQAAAAGGGGPRGANRQPMGANQPQGAVAQILALLAKSTAENSAAITQLAQVMASPTVVETPRGQYVARKVMQ